MVHRVGFTTASVLKKTKLDPFCRLGTIIHRRDGQTERHRSVAHTALCHASRGKNQGCDIPKRTTTVLTGPASRRVFYQWTPLDREKCLRACNRGGQSGRYANYTRGGRWKTQDGKTQDWNWRTEWRHCSRHFGSRPSDHYFRSVCWFVCLFVCLFVQSFSQPSLIPYRSN